MPTDHESSVEREPLTVQNASLADEADNPDPGSPSHDTTQETPQEMEGTAESDKITSKGPFWLRKAALILFCSLFTACALSLIALDRVIASQNGLSLSITSSSYTWTYGPTAILVVILSFWRRIDYYYKSSQPWRELWTGPAPAEKSLLLDYISPFQPATLMRAFRNKHWSVFMTILSFFLLKFVILISTTLFVVRPSSGARSTIIQYQNEFEAPPPQAWETGTEYAGFPSINGSSAAVWAYLAKLNNDTTSDTRWKTPDGRATQSFSPSAAEDNVAFLEAPVDVFVPEISCEDAIVSIPEVDIFGLTDTMQLDFQSATCSAGGENIEPCRIEGECPQVPLTFTIFIVNCSFGPENASHNRLDFDMPWPDRWEPYDLRYAITLTEHGLEHKKNNSSGEESIVATDPIKYASIICKIGYRVVTANATLDVLTGDVTFPPEALNGDGRLIRNLSSMALGYMLYMSIYQSESLILDPTLET